MRFDFYNDSDNRSKMGQSFLPLYDIFEKRLGWTKPSFTAQISDHSCDIAFYDEASEGKPNRWFEAQYANFSISKLNGAYVLIQNLHKPVALQRSLNHERWVHGNIANGEWENLYKTCVKDPITVFGEFSTRRENLCDVSCNICKEHIKSWNLKFGTTDPNKPKSRREIVEEKKRKKKNLKIVTKIALQDEARGYTYIEPKPFKKSEL